MHHGLHAARLIRPVNLKSLNQKENNIERALPSRHDTPFTYKIRATGGGFRLVSLLPGSRRLQWVYGIGHAERAGGPLKHHRDGKSDAARGLEPRTEDDKRSR